MISLQSIREPLPVSVVVPLYNKATYVQTTLTSILDQTYPPCEVIVVDDGSTDDGPERVKAFVSARPDSRIRLIHQENQGPGGARNRGLAEAIAPYVAFLDADDEWLPAFLATSTRALQLHPDCVLSVMGQLRGPDRQDWAAVWKPLGITAGAWRLPQTLAAKAYKPNLDVLHSGAMVCDRAVLQRFGGFYDSNHCRYGEDIYLWLQVILNYPIYRSLEPLMWYHTEASDLAVWRQQSCPPWPMLLDPEPIRRVCPPDYQNLLEDLLASYALIAAYRAATGGDIATAEDLFRRFPLARASASDVWRVRLEGAVSAVPNLRRALKQFKRSLGS